MSIRKLAAIIGVTGIILALTACGGADKDDINQTKVPDITTQDEADDNETEQTESQGTDDTESEPAGFTFADVDNFRFVFSSGAGGWSTQLDMHGDGSFEGLYHDSDMGSTGEGYPHGTVYECEFEGKFTEPVKVNDYTYSVTIASIEYDNEPETEEIDDDIKYVYSVPYGIDGAKELYFYLPGAPLENLPQEYLEWIGYPDLTATPDTQLLTYGLYNVTEKDGFLAYELTGEEGELGEDSTDDVDSSADDDLAEAETRAKQLEEKLQNESLTQQEMNQISAELYALWDEKLNEVWGELKDELPEAEMKELTEEELVWIANKEQQIAEAGAEYEGGSMQALQENMKGAELTRARVCELVERLK